MTVPGAGSEPAGNVYSYVGHTKSGMLASATDWHNAEGNPAEPTSSPGTTLKVSLQNRSQLVISVPDSFTVGRIIIGDSAEGLDAGQRVSWNGDTSLTMTREGGEPGEFLLESPRNERGSGGGMSGCVVRVLLQAPNGLIFGGAGGGGASVQQRGSDLDLHRLTILRGIDAGGTSAKVGSVEAVVCGDVNFHGQLEVREGSMIVASAQERKKGGKTEDTRFRVKSLRVSNGAEFLFFAPTEEAAKPALVLTLEQPDNTPFIESEGVFRGLGRAFLELQTPDLKAPKPGIYHLIQRSRVGKGEDKFANVTLNGGELPANCQIEYGSEGRIINLVVTEN